MAIEERYFQLLFGEKNIAGYFCAFVNMINKHTKPSKKHFLREKV